IAPRRWASLAECPGNRAFSVGAQLRRALRGSVAPVPKGSPSGGRGQFTDGLAALLQQRDRPADGVGPGKAAQPGQAEAQELPPAERAGTAVPWTIPALHAEFSLGVAKLRVCPALGFHSIGDGRENLPIAVVRPAPRRWSVGGRNFAPPGGRRAPAAWGPRGGRRRCTRARRSPPWR